MDIRRIILYAAFAFVAYTLWTNWQVEYPTAPQSIQSSINADSVTSIENNLMPKMAETEPTQSIDNTPPTQNKSKLTQAVNVKTDVLNIFIDLQHGRYR